MAVTARQWKRVSPIRGWAKADDDAANPWFVLAVLCAGIFMLLLDSTIMSVAQQPIRTSLGASLGQIQWALNAYVLTYVVLLLTTGRLGDLIGRKRSFLLGLTIFTGASALAGAVSWTGGVAGISGPHLLIAARVVQGIGGALMIPQSMALVSVAFPPERRGSAFGVWSSVIALAAVVGPILGGFMASQYNWGWLFLINVPIGVVVLILVALIVPESMDSSASRRFDIGGILLSSVAIFGLVFPLIEANSYGWTHPRIVGMFSLGILALGALIWWERRVAEPMLRFAIYRARNVWAGTVAMGASSFAFFGMMLPLTVLLQSVLGRSAIEAGLALAPVGLMIAVVAPVGGWLSDRIGSREILTGGFLLASAGFVLLALTVDPSSSILSLLPALVTLGVGFGLTTSQINAVPMRDIPANLLGAASGQLNTARTVSIALGFAILTTLLQSAAAQRSTPVVDRLPISAETRAASVAIVEEGRFDQLPDIGTPTEQAHLVSAIPDLQASFVDAAQVVFLALAVILLLAAGASTLVRKSGAS